MGVDIHSAVDDTVIILPNDRTVSIPADIALEPPSGKYIRIASHIGLAFKHNIHVISGVIDFNYHKNIMV